MAIRLETSKRTGVANFQGHAISTFHLNWVRDLAKGYPRARPRTGVSAVYNCHGLSFASRRTSIETNSGIQAILTDDRYREIALRDVLPGDVALYYSDTGDPNHSGVVVEAGGDLITPIVCSKWGHAGEFVHALRDCPSVYGPNVKFFRCEL